MGSGAAPNGGMPSNAMSPQLKDVRIDQKLNSQVPLNLSFRDESGQPVTLGRYFTGRPVILSLVYFNCPMLCPEVVQGITKTLNVVKLDLGKDYDVLTVSFDPNDTPQAATEKKRLWLAGLDKRNDQNGWHFLTGDQTAITALTQAVGFHYNWDPQQKMFAHATGIMVLTPDGKVSKYFYGADYSPTDLRFGLIDASHAKIGTLVDEVLLFCCKYNATSGKYDLLVSRLLAIGGTVTIVGLGSFLLIMFKISPKRRAA
jgi:protein SCO1